MAINDAEITGARNPLETGFSSEKRADSIDRRIAVAPMMDGSHWGGRACGNKDLRYRGKACTNFVTAGVEDGIAGEA